jgi:hypothetical protein
MEPIHVPSPPKTAFNKQRRMSDLIRKQVEHFKHLEHKLPAELRDRLPQHPIVSEDDAARYIAPMTRLLLSREQPGQAKPVIVRKPMLSKRTLALAAAAEPEIRPKKKSSPNAVRKSKPARKRKK